MKLIDPTAKDQIQQNQMAPRLEGLEKKRIGILVNGKANSKELLLKTAKLFKEQHNCEIVEEFQYIQGKPPVVIQDAAKSLGLDPTVTNKEDAAEQIAEAAQKEVDKMLEKLDHEA